VSDDRGDDRGEDDRDGVWPGESYDTRKDEVVEPTGSPGSVQEVVSDAQEESELEGELNEVASVTDAARSVQRVVEEPTDGDGDGGVGDGE